MTLCIDGSFLKPPSFLFGNSSLQSRSVIFLTETRPCSGRLLLRLQGKEGLTECRVDRAQEAHAED